MRANRLHRLERYWKVGTRLPSLDCTSEGQEFLRGGEGGGYRFFESEQRQGEDEVYEASIVTAILIINNWKPLRSSFQPR